MYSVSRHSAWEAVEETRRAMKLFVRATCPTVCPLSYVSYAHHGVSPLSLCALAIARYGNLRK
jgi:hypothetical protein